MRCCISCTPRCNGLGRLRIVPSYNYSDVADQVDKKIIVTTARFDIGDLHPTSPAMREGCVGRPTLPAFIGWASLVVLGYHLSQLKHPRFPSVHSTSHVLLGIAPHLIRECLRSVFSLVSTISIQLGIVKSKAR
jgi:hypothetical protein